MKRVVENVVNFFGSVCVWLILVAQPCSVFAQPITRAKLDSDGFKSDTYDLILDSKNTEVPNSQYCPETIAIIQLPTDPATNPGASLIFVTDPKSGKFYTAGEFDEKIRDLGFKWYTHGDLTLTNLDTVPSPNGPCEGGNCTVVYKQNPPAIELNDQCYNLSPNPKTNCQAILSAKQLKNSAGTYIEFKSTQTNPDPKIYTNYVCNYRRGAICRPTLKFYFTWPTSLEHIRLIHFGGTIYDNNYSNVITKPEPPITEKNTYKDLAIQGGTYWNSLSLKVPTDTSLTQSEVNLFNNQRSALVEIRNQPELQPNEKGELALTEGYRDVSGVKISKPGNPRILILTTPFGIMKDEVLVDLDSMKSTLKKKPSYICSIGGWTTLPACPQFTEVVAGGTLYKGSKYGWVILEISSSHPELAPLTSMVMRRLGPPSSIIGKQDQILYNIGSNDISASKTFINWASGSSIPTESVFYAQGPILPSMEGGAIVNDQGQLLGLLTAYPRGINSDDSVLNYAGISTRYILDDIQKNFPSLYNELNIAP